jgi:hypothetical protein
MRPGDVVTERYRAYPDPNRGHIKGQRKVHLILGPSRAAGKVRVVTWSHNSRGWSLPRTKREDGLCPAPADWPQTKAVAKWTAERGQGTAVLLMAERGRRG